MDKTTFRHQMEIALLHIRDVVKLRTMPLAKVLVSMASPDRKGWALSRFMLSAIEGLQPVQDEQDYWPQRRYDLLTLRYVNCLPPAAVADQLAISERHFYRQAQRALDELADYIWAATVERTQGSIPGTWEQPQESQDISTGLLQSEYDSLLDLQQCSLHEVIQSVVEVLSPIAKRRSITLDETVRSSSNICLNPQVLKQFLLGVLGQLITSDGLLSISLTAQMTSNGLQLQMEAKFSESRKMLADAHTALLEKSSSQLAMLHGVRVQAKYAEGRVVYTAILPTVGDRAILVVDDNEDVRLLFRRYLLDGGYHALLAGTGTQALELARTRRLFAITLDIMMSNGDGWDVLQTLTLNSETAQIPIIICSVLDSGELATMLGARHFLKKPVMCESLLNILESLK